MRWLLTTLLVILLGGAIARQGLAVAGAEGVTVSGQNAFVDSLLWAASLVTLMAVVPVYFTFRAIADSRRDYDEGYIKLWSYVTTEDMRKRAGAPGRVVAVPVEKKTYSEMLYGKKETER